jgi:hypothetical protein
MSKRPDSAAEFLLDSNGNAPRPVAAGLLAVPTHIELDKSTNELVWQAQKGSPLFQMVEPGRRAFLDFLNLAEEEPAAFIRYAGRWGVLGLCAPHQLPFTHNWLLGSASASIRLGLTTKRDDAKETECLAVGLRALCKANPQKYGIVSGSPSLRCLVGRGYRRGPAGGRESLEPWRRLATHARAVIRTAQRLHEGKLEAQGTTRDRDIALSDLELLEPGFSRRLSYRALDRSWKLDIQRRLVERAVNDWLSLAAARPFLAWGGPNGPIRPSVVLGGPQYLPNLFGYIAIQLMFRVAEIRVLGTCVVCGKAYEPAISPKRTQRNYCPECRSSGAAARFRAAANYRRKKTKGRKKR